MTLVSTIRGTKRGNGCYEQKQGELWDQLTLNLRSMLNGRTKLTKRHHACLRLRSEVVQCR